MEGGCVATVPAEIPHPPPPVAVPTWSRGLQRLPTLLPTHAVLHTSAQLGCEDANTWILI